MRLYFDTNIFEKNILTSSQYSEDVSNAFRKIKNSSVIPFSDAHLEDFKNILNSEMLKIKLQNLRSLCSDTYFKTNLKTEFEIFIQDPFSAFEGKHFALVDKYLASGNNDGIFNDFINSVDDSNVLNGWTEILKNFFDEKINLIKSQPIPKLDFSNFDQEQLEKFRELMPGYQDMQTIGDMMNSSLLRYGLLSNDKSEFTKFRKYTQSIIDSNDYSYNQKGDAFDKLLEKSPLKQQFSNLIETIFPSNAEINNYHKIQLAYLFLDMYNIAPDKRKGKLKEATLWNMSADSHHVFFGSYCDYLISDDKGLLVKAKIIYNLLNIPTKLLDAKAFVSEADNLGLKPHPEKDFFEEIFYLLTEPKRKIGRSESSNCEVIFNEFAKPLFNYFTNLQASINKSDQLSVVCFRYRGVEKESLIVYKEIDLLIAQLVQIFGEDDNKMHLYSYKENILSDIPIRTWNTMQKIVKVFVSNNSDGSYIVLEIIIKTAPE